MRIRPPAAALSCFLAMLSPVTGASESLHYLGTAYAAHGGQKLYVEEHFVFEQNQTPTRLVLYRCPSGQPFARKWVRDESSPFAPDFDLIDARTGYREGVSGTQGARKVYTQADSHSPVRSAPLHEPANEVIDAGFDAYVRDHWDTLAQDGQVAFLVPSRLGYVDVRLTNASSGADARHIHLKMDAWYGFLAPSIDLTYETADRRLMQFDGVSNIHDASGHNQTVRIEFPRSAQKPAPSAQEIQRAAAIPLVDHCAA